MTLPFFGPMALSGFSHVWYFLFLLVVVGVVALYISVQASRRKRMLRFANTELLESVAPHRPNQWRHVPIILMVAALLMLTVAMAGPTNEIKIPAQSGGGDAGDRRVAIHGRHRYRTVQVGGRAGGVQAVRQ